HRSPPRSSHPPALWSRRSCRAAPQRPRTRNAWDGRWTIEQGARRDVDVRTARECSKHSEFKERRWDMRIVIIGGTGLIGSKTAPILRQKGHEVVAAAPNTGVNTITGVGLKEAMAGTQVVIDLANSPSFEDKAVLEFFETSGRNLHAAEAAAGVTHHVALLD